MQHETKGESMKSITATEFKENLGKYLAMAEQEDVYITKQGKPVAKLTSPYLNKRMVAESLLGILKESEVTLDEAREERLSKI
jgi:prevent-host-death family protein